MFGRLWDRLRGRRTEEPEPIARREPSLIPRSDDLTYVPSGSAKVEVDFVVAGPVGTSFQELVDKIERMQEMQYKLTARVPLNDMLSKSQAELFVEWIKENHKLPDLTDASLAKSLNVSGFGYKYDPQGHYRLSFADFKDESTWESGSIYA